MPGQRVALTLCFGLRCTHLYPGPSPEFDRAIGGEVSPGETSAEHLTLMARPLECRHRDAALMVESTDQTAIVLGMRPAPQDGLLMTSPRAGQPVVRVARMRRPRSVVRGAAVLGPDGQIHIADG